MATDSNGKMYETSESAATGASGVTIVKENIPTGTKAIVYLEPTNLGTECNAQNSISTTGTKSGCMKWYAYKETNDSYTMILDHNTTTSVAWNSSGNTADGMNEVQTALESDTSNWTGSPRLITGQEVADITGISWTLSGSSVSFMGSNTPSEYYWLYDYTYNCTDYGCNIADSSTDGYWTSTSKSSSGAWHVHCYGILSSASVGTTSYGVRPVIEVSKSNL